MTRMQKKSLDTSPDEIRIFENGRVELANFDNVTIGQVGAQLVDPPQKYGGGSRSFGLPEAAIPCLVGSRRWRDMFGDLSIHYRPKFTGTVMSYSR